MTCWNSRLICFSKCSQIGVGVTGLALKKLLEIFVDVMITAHAKYENAPIRVGHIVDRASIANLYPPKWCICLQLDRSRRGRIGLQ
jgi:hypothetical protein